MSDPERLAQLRQLLADAVARGDEDTISNLLHDLATEFPDEPPPKSDP